MPQMMTDWFTRLADLLSVSEEQLEEKLVRFQKRRPDAPTVKAIRNWHRQPTYRLTRRGAVFIWEFCRTELQNQVLTGKDFESLRDFLHSRIRRTHATQKIVEEVKATTDTFSEHLVNLISKDGSFLVRASSYQGFYALFRIDSQENPYQELFYIGGPGEETLLLNYGGYVFRGCTFVASSVASTFLIASHLNQPFCFRFLILNTGGDERRDIHSGLLTRIEDVAGSAETSEIIVQWMDPDKYTDLAMLLHESRRKERLDLEKHPFAGKYAGPRGKNDPRCGFAILSGLKPPYASKTPHDIQARWDDFRQRAPH